MGANVFKWLRRREHAGIACKFRKLICSIYYLFTYFIYLFNLFINNIHRCSRNFVGHFCEKPVATSGLSKCRNSIIIKKSIMKLFISWNNVAAGSLPLVHQRFDAAAGCVADFAVGQGKKADKAAKGWHQIG
jgi:hypothetical protein